MRRRIVTTLYRGHDKRVVRVRYYNWMDTAVPRVVQLALHDGESGDVVEFVSAEFGFQLGIMHQLPKGKFDLIMSDLVKNSPSLLKLV